VDKFSPLLKQRGGLKPPLEKIKPLREVPPTKGGIKGKKSVNTKGVLNLAPSNGGPCLGPTWNLKDSLFPKIV